MNVCLEYLVAILLAVAFTPSAGLSTPAARSRRVSKCRVAEYAMRRSWAARRGPPKQDMEKSATARADESEKIILNAMLWMRYWCLPTRRCHVQ